MLLSSKMTSCCSLIDVNTPAQSTLLCPRQEIKFLSQSRKLSISGNHRPQGKVICILKGHFLEWAKFQPALQPVCHSSYAKYTMPIHEHYLKVLLLPSQFMKQQGLTGYQCRVLDRYLIVKYLKTDLVSTYLQIQILLRGTKETTAHFVPPLLFLH